MALPDKIHAVEYAGFWDFNLDGNYGDSVITETDTPNAGEIALEMAKRYNEYPDLIKKIQDLESKVK